MASKTEAFSSFGAKLTNPQWSWSAKADDSVVLTLWADKFTWKDELASYDGSHEPGDEAALGNKERLRHLVWARDHCEGRIKVVMVKRAATTGTRRTIKEVYPRADLMMRLTELDERTGEFRAEGMSNARSS